MKTDIEFKVWDMDNNHADPIFAIKGDNDAAIKAQSEWSVKHSELAVHTVSVNAFAWHTYTIITMAGKDNQLAQYTIDVKTD